MGSNILLHQDQFTQKSYLLLLLDHYAAPHLLHQPTYILCIVEVAVISTLSYTKQQRGGRFCMSCYFELKIPHLSAKSGLFSTPTFLGGLFDYSCLLPSKTKQNKTKNMVTPGLVEEGDNQERFELTALTLQGSRVKELSYNLQVRGI